LEGEDIESLEKEDGESSEEEEDKMVGDEDEDEDEDEEKGIELKLADDDILIPCCFYILINIAIIFNVIVVFFNMRIISACSLNGQLIK